jgi:hypothetical protein
VLFVSAFAYPLILGILSLGVGLLIERVSVARVDVALLLPFGFVGLIVVTQLGTALDATARLTLPFVVALAIAGLVTGRRRLRGASSTVLAPALLAVAVYGCFVASVVLAGHPEFTSYGVDSTPAFHWLGADHLAHSGRDFSDAGQSAATAITASYFDNAYPSGVNTVLGVTARLAGVATPWLWQPLLAYIGALLGLALFALVRPAVGRARHAAAIAFIGAQPALYYAFFLQGQAKEVTAAMLLVLLGWAVWSYARNPPSAWRSTILLALVGAAGTATTGYGFGLWLAPAALIALVGALRAFWAQSKRELALHVAGFVVVYVVAALPTLTGLTAYFRSVNNLLTNEPPLGSLLKPLSPLQVGGIWLSNDYRLRPVAGLSGVNSLLVGLVGVAALVAIVWIIRRRHWALVAYVAILVPGCLALAARGTPWIDTKAMVVAAPAAVVLGMLVAPALAGTAGTAGRVSGVVAAVGIGVGVLWSNALLYHNTQLAPSKRYQELDRIGQLFKGYGPTLRPDFDDYALYFLKDMTPNAPGDAQPVVASATTNGVGAAYGRSFRMDDLDPAYVTKFRTIVLQRSPFESRPPAVFRRVWQGRYYEVWQRGPGEVVDHEPSGSGWKATGRLSCTSLRSLARRARRDGTGLAVAQRPADLQINTATLPLPSGWARDRSDNDLVIADGPGRLEARITVDKPGRRMLWLAGSFTRPVRVLVDHRQVATLSDDIKYSGLAQAVGIVDVSAGAHIIDIVRSKGSLAPGNGVPGTFGPLALTPEDKTANGVRYVKPGSYRTICGHEVDWVELVRGTPGASP